MASKENTLYVKEFYTLDQLGKDLNFSIQSLRKFVKDGELVASKVGTKYVVKRDDIIKWLNNNKV